MLQRVIDFSLKNKFVVLLATAAAVLGGVYAVKNIPLDAIPDLSDTQVIIYTGWEGQAPNIVEDQVTYPITTKMLSVPRQKAVRGYSFYGFSFVYVIFEDGTDPYWARSRVLEYLSGLSGQLPKGVTPSLGPDATGVGWAFMYSINSTNRDLAELRSYQDWYLKYQLTAVDGVSEVASVGGFVKQYQVTVDPTKLRAYNLSLKDVSMAIERSNGEVGGRSLELSEREFILRVKGYVQSLDDLRKVAVGSGPNGVPILLRDVATVQFGPDMRRGIAEQNGEGETVGGIVVGRYGANANQVIQAVKQRLDQAMKALPPDVKYTVVYDRSALIDRAVKTLEEKLLEESLVVALVCLAFLLHLRSALVAIIILPIAVLIAFMVMFGQGISSNIMSLGGIAIAVGAMVDAVIIMIENAHKHLERDRGKKPHWEIIRDAAVEVGPTLFYSLLVITVSFIPVFTLQAQEGRLFKPLAYTKNFTMIVAAVLALTLDPALRLLFFRKEGFKIWPRWFGWIVNGVLVGKVHSEEKHPLSRALKRLYAPVVEWTLRWKWLVLAGAVALVVVTIPVYQGLGSEFMPPLDEGTLLFMPTTLPGISAAQAGRLLQMQDRTLMRFPEVERVLGKAGRAETPTDPAPLSMMETVITLRPKSQWRRVATWYDRWPESIKPLCGRITPDRISTEQLVDEMDGALQFPGVSNAWTMPIKARIDMLTTGVRTPVGIKVFGPDLAEIERIGTALEGVLPRVSGTRSVFAERVNGGYFLDFDLKRDQLARYGLSVDDAEAVVVSAIGGENVSTSIQGLERYPINVRYYRDSRSSIERLNRVLVPAMGGKAQIPLAEIATLKLATGPAMLRNENGMLSGYVYVDVAGRDVGSYVAAAKQAVLENVATPPGYTLVWSGQYEAMERVHERLKVVLPLTLFLIFLLLYLNTRSTAKTVIILLAVPFSAVGAIWLLNLLGYNMSIGVWVGLIALMGVDAETGVFMLLYLDLAFEERRQAGLMRTHADLREAIVHGAVKRIRPKFMTVATMFVGLAPIMWSHGTGADVMKRIAAPMIGGIFTSFLLELVVYPAIYEVWKWHSAKRQAD